jgi:LmbE family N-acetylglucosaminyl deacetylase
VYVTIAVEAHAAMQNLPLGDIECITGGTSPMILAPHPDDEVLGCGGLILQALAAGIPPVVAIITDGSGSHPNSRKYPPAELKALRQVEACRAAAILGLPLSRLHFLGCRDTEAPHNGPEFERIVERITRISAEAGCGVILAPWHNDPHCDHVATHNMAVAAARTAGLRHLSYPVWGWSLPNSQYLGDLTVCGRRLNIDSQLERKQLALQAHASQMGRVIDDDPFGFQLTPDILGKLLRPFEIFLENR